MTATPYCEHFELESDGTRIVVEYDRERHARLDVTTSGYRYGSAEAGRLAQEAIHQARLHHADRIDGALDASSPACGAILAALHQQIGDDLDSIVMRRAGSSVLVTLETHPIPTTTTLLPRPAVSPHPPARPRLHRTPRVGAATPVR